MSQSDVPSGYRVVTALLSRCTACDREVVWVVCPTGGWWRHEQRTTDGHDAMPPGNWSPCEEFEEAYSLG